MILLEAVTAVSLMVSNPDFAHKSASYYESDDHEFELSDDKNFIILLLDCFDATYYQEAVSDELTAKLDGFTFYPDTMSMYGHTTCSISQMLSGAPFTNQTPYREYEEKEFEAGPLLKRLNSEDWNIGLYSEYVFPRVDALDNTDNLKIYESKITSKSKFYKTIYRVVGYNIVPYHFKQLLWFYPNLVDMKDSPVDMKYSAYLGENERFYVGMDDFKICNSTPTFKFYHVDGMHTPYMTDADVSQQEEETSFEEAREANYKIIDKFIDELKQMGVYDNTAIMIAADHGGMDNLNGYKQNPLFMVKGFNENHEYKVSDTALSYVDLPKIYDAMLDGKTGEDVMAFSSDYENDRERLFYVYGFDYMDQMEEYGTRGKAWENEGFYYIKDVHAKGK